LHKVSLIQFSNNRRANDSNIVNYGYFTTQSHLSEILHSLKNKTSSGIDKIPNIVLRNLPNQVINIMVIIFNNCLNLSYFPKDWKPAKVVTIKKPGKDSCDLNSYRPISLLPNLGKIFEIVVNQILVKETEDRKIIPDNQFGFRHKHSTTHAMTKLSSDICRYINNKNCVATCFIDLEKAFDTVWLDGLIYKLLSYKFPIYFVFLINDMIRERSFSVISNTGNNSKRYFIKDGLQQGTVNSPFLFNIYISGLLDSLSKSRGHNQCIAYADDLTIYSANSDPRLAELMLQKQFEKTINYCKN
jgi:hypothetical protein